MRAVWLIGAGAMLMAAPGVADVKAVVDAWSRGDWATAVREWRPPAVAGDPDAQFPVGRLSGQSRAIPPQTHDIR